MLVQILVVPLDLGDHHARGRGPGPDVCHAGGEGVKFMKIKCPICDGHGDIWVEENNQVHVEDCPVCEGGYQQLNIFGWFLFTAAKIRFWFSRILAKARRTNENHDNY